MFFAILAQLLFTILDRSIFGNPEGEAQSSKLRHFRQKYNVNETQGHTASRQE